MGGCVCVGGGGGWVSVCVRMIALECQCMLHMDVE